MYGNGKVRAGEAKVAVRSFCHRSTWQSMPHHHWVQDARLTRRGKNGVLQWFFHCKLCQIVKMKLLEMHDDGGGNYKAVVREVFPSGQIVDELIPTVVLTEQEEWEIKNNRAAAKRLL